jgi:hypothetical protein
VLLDDNLTLVVPSPAPDWLKVMAARLQAEIGWHQHQGGLLEAARDGDLEAGALLGGELAYRVESQALAAR